MTVSGPSSAFRSEPTPAVESAAKRASGGRVVPFAPAAHPRRRPEAGEPRGEILLFLGVRYERLAG